MEHPTPTFLDVNFLLEASQPRPRTNWFWYGVGVFALVAMIATYVSRQSQAARVLVDLASLVLMIGLGAGLSMLTWRTVRAQRGEQQRVEAIEELVQLRRWEQAAVMLQAFLSRPARMPQSRAQAMIYLASVLARYHRFDDAIGVQSYLIDHELADPGTTYGLRLGRAMAMLREDHLVDADRALGDIRRIVGDQQSAGLALIEIYRDVKTGHYAEAIEVFESNLKTLREQLGHRVADAYALVACAYDLLGRADEAARMYDNATRLAPADELHRRYPEVAKMAGKYRIAAAPQEGA